MTFWKNLSEEEVELLKKLGIPIPKEEVKKASYSIRAVKTCKACGSREETFLDALPRYKCPGYVWKSVAQPSCVITEEITYHTTKCSSCTGENLKNKSRDELMKIIERLRP